MNFSTAYTNALELTSETAPLARLLEWGKLISSHSPANRSAKVLNHLEDFIKDSAHTLEDRFAALQMFDFIDGCFEESKEQWQDYCVKAGGNFEFAAKTMIEDFIETI